MAAHQGEYQQGEYQQWFQTTGRSSIFTRFKEQLGPKVVPKKGLGEFIPSEASWPVAASHE